MKLLSNELSAHDVKLALASQTRQMTIDNVTVGVLDGAVTVPNFLTPEGRQHIEGQVYSYGRDLTKVYRTGWAGYGDHELNIVNADEQVPLIKELKVELEEFIAGVFEEPLHTHAFQLRELQPGYNGHPRHVDYERGADIIDRDGKRVVVTSVSLSLPLGWNGGKAPEFQLEVSGGIHLQDTPASLTIFGPQVFHQHPSCEDLREPFLWLITQCFFHAAVPSSAVTANVKGVAVSAV